MIGIIYSGHVHIVTILNWQVFKEYIREYDEEDEGMDKERIRCCIEDELREDSQFTAFKRWIIWDNAERYPEFAEFLQRLLEI